MSGKKKKKILIVEDEKPLAKALRMKLKKAGGFDIAVAENGKEALEEIDKDKPDLILMDLIMPIMDGFTVLQQLKKKKIDVPVVVLSNLSQDEDIERAKEMGAKDFFIKSDIEISKVVDYIEKNID